MRGIGVGGFTGFNDVPPPPTATQFLNIDGGHGAGLTSERLAAVTDYIKNGTTPAVILLGAVGFIHLVLKVV